MHTYRKSEDYIWTVGYYGPSEKSVTWQGYVWRPLKDFTIEAEAAAHVNYLNGGTGRYPGE